MRTCSSIAAPPPTKTTMTTTMTTERPTASPAHVGATMSITAMTTKIDEVAAAETEAGVVDEQTVAASASHIPADEDGVHVDTPGPEITESMSATSRPPRSSRRQGARAAAAGAAPVAALGAPPPLQDPGSHQAPPDHPGAGRQGRARQQGRGADDLSVARRPLLRADAQHAARRRHFAQDHQRHRPQAPEERGAGARTARGHGPDHPHRRREPHQGRDQARLRISAAHVGHDPRDDAQFHRAGLRL